MGVLKSISNNHFSTLVSQQIKCKGDEGFVTFCVFLNIFGYLYHNQVVDYSIKDYLTLQFRIVS